MAVGGGLARRLITVQSVGMKSTGCRRTGGDRRSMQLLRKLALTCHACMLQGWTLVNEHNFFTMPLQIILMG